MRLLSHCLVHKHHCFWAWGLNLYGAIFCVKSYYCMRYSYLSHPIDSDLMLGNSIKVKKIQKLSLISQAEAYMKKICRPSDNIGRTCLWWRGQCVSLGDNSMWLLHCHLPFPFTLFDSETSVHFLCSHGHGDVKPATR